MQADRVWRSELTPVGFLKRSASIFPNRTAVIHGSRRYSYQQLAERVNRFASCVALIASLWYPYRHRSKQKGPKNSQGFDVTSEHR